MINPLKPADGPLARPGALSPLAPPAPFYNWLEQPTPATSWLAKAGPIARRLLAEQERDL